MNRSALAFACLFLAGPAQADVHTWRDADGVVHFSDRVLAQADTRRQLTPEREPVDAHDVAGEWEAHTTDGTSASFSLNDAGGFIYDRQHADTPERLYMCGNWTTLGTTIELQVLARKEQFASGVIIEASEDSLTGFEIVSVNSTRLVIRTDLGETLTFRPVG